MLYGIIDIGSNTIRMAIYLIEGSHIEMLMKKRNTGGLDAYLKGFEILPRRLGKGVGTF